MLLKGFYLRVVKSWDCVVNRPLKVSLCKRVNSLPNDNILDVTKLKVLVDNKLNVAIKTIFLFDRVENTVEQGENAGKLLAFSPCPSVFQTLFF